MKFGRLYTTSLFALLATAIAAPVAHAQVEEIIVTSRKRDERIQDVPVAVTAITQETINAVKPRTLQDLDGLAPNLFIGMNTAGPGASAIYLRGIGYADIEKTQTPIVGVMLDGVFLGTSTGALLDAFDIQQVEVNRGPQGVEEGKNTSGGTIKVTRSRPTMDWGFKGSASYGSYDEVVLRGVLNAPIVRDRVGLKFGYTYKNRDGFYSDLYDKQSRGDVEYTGINAAVFAKLSDSADALLVFDYVADRSEGNPVVVQNPIAGGPATARLDGLDGPPAGSNTVVSGNPYNLSPHQVLNDFPEKSYLDLWRGSLELNWDTGVGKITSITGYMKFNDYVNQDFDGTCVTNLQGLGCQQASLTARLFVNPPGIVVPVPLGNPLLFPAPSLHTTRDQNYEQISQELRMATNLTDTIKMLVGAYYFEDEIALQQLTRLTVLPRTQQISGQKSDSIAFFGNLEWEIAPGFLINGGARWLRENKRFNTQIGNYELGPAGQGSVLPRRELANSWEDLITRAGLTWKFAPNHMFYFTRAEGFRSGGFSIRATLSEQIAGQSNCPNPGPVGTVTCPNNNFAPFAPETNTNYEIGSKNTFFDNQLSVNIAAFLNRVKGSQGSSIVTTPGFGPGTNTYIINAQLNVYKGIELEVNYAPEWLPGFRLNGSLGVQDGKNKENCQDNRVLPVGAGSTAGTSGTTCFTSNLPLTRVADYNYSFLATYEHPLFDGTLRTAVSWRYIDDFSITTQAGFGVGADIQKGYGLLDASVAFEWQNYTLSFIGKNLTDKVYRNHSLPTVFFTGYGDPITVAGELAVKF